MQFSGFLLIVGLDQTVNSYTFLHMPDKCCVLAVLRLGGRHSASSSVLKLSSNESRYHAVTTVNVCSALCILSINTVFL